MHKEFDFPADKNQWLKDNREISFEEVISALEEGGLIEVIKHPNLVKYPHQSMYVIDIGGYIYLVPFVKKNKTCVFLKTIFKSRKMTRQYLHDKEKTGDSL